MKHLIAHLTSKGKVFSENTLKSLGKDPSTDINGTFLLLCTLFKSTEDAGLILAMFKTISAPLATLIGHTMIHALRSLLEQTQGGNVGASTV
jgi:hypothetical protein